MKKQIYGGGDMMIIFASQGKFASLIEGKLRWYNSQYLASYKKNLEDIYQRNAWKTQGTGALFTGAYKPLPQEEHSPAGEILGLSPTENGDILYSVKIENSSGIFRKDPGANGDMEGHIIHKHDTVFHNLDYNTTTQQIIVSISEGPSKHLALFKKNSAFYSVLTEGDSRDENPIWSKTDPDTVYYDSCGIGKDNNGSFLGFGTRTICSLNLSNNHIDEVIAIDNYNCLAPREDNQGNLYFLKTPVIPTKKSTSLFLDILLIPFRLLKALFSWANIFTMRYSGETLTSAGANPANIKQRKAGEILIEGNLINAQKTLKINKALGEKYPGVIPKTWQLVKRDPFGTLTTIKKGVMAFDVDGDEEVVYSNGRHVLTIRPDGSEEVVATVPMATSIRNYSSPSAL